MTTYWAILEDGRWHEVSHDVYLARQGHFPQQTLATVVPPSPTVYMARGERHATGGAHPHPRRPLSIGHAGVPSFAKNGAEPPGYLEDNARLSWWLPELTAKQHAAIARFDADCARAQLAQRPRPPSRREAYRPLYDGLRDPDPLEEHLRWHLDRIRPRRRRCDA